ncbi:MAG: DUF2752 domain-containing protein [Bacteroidales bacterium]
MKANKAHNIRLAVIVSGIIAASYFFIDPAGSRYFPKCLIHSFTGYQCACCGSQRAFHQLLHLNISEAFKLNALFVLFILYALLILIISFTKRENKITNNLLGTKALAIYLTISILFGILRNIV